MLKNGPVLWEALLEAIDLDGAVVAGGCIRDYLLRLEPKDIDIFVPHGNRQEFEELIASLNATGIFDLTLMDGEAYRTDDMLSVVGVAEGEALGFPINIIARIAHLSGAWELINSFDFGILQWAFVSTKEPLISTTQAFMDIALRNATLAHDRTREQSIERFKRFERRTDARLLLIDPYAPFTF